MLQPAERPWNEGTMVKAIAGYVLGWGREAVIFVSCISLGDATNNEDELVAVCMMPPEARSPQ